MAKYTVKKGDTLSGIAKRHGTTVAKIQAANAALIKDPNKIKIGWVLEIPAQTSGSTSATNKSPQIAAALDKCIADVLALPSFNALEVLINGDEN